MNGARGRAGRLALRSMVGLALLASGCATEAEGAGPAPSVQVAVASPSPSSQAAAYTGSLSVVPAHGPAGTEVEVIGRELPPSSELDLVWSTADCRWLIEGQADEEYHGRECTPNDVVLGSLRTDASGAAEGSFVVPDDYGFAHDVKVVDGEGVVRNQASFNVDMQVTVTPSRGPVGTPITIEVKGIGWQTLENNRTILYDNAYVGWISAVTTRGTARAVIPATGGPGKHQIVVARGAYTFPYLNPVQSPRPDIPVFEATFTVTDGKPVLPPRTSQQNPPVRYQQADLVASDAPAIATTLASGPVATRFTIAGQGFQPGSRVALDWFRIVGNRVSGQGWDEEALRLGAVVADGEGAFELTTEIPGDVGGPHRIGATVDGATLAETSVSVTPAAARLTRSSGPWGSEFDVRVNGVGWTETANIYTIVYDNVYIGYACGFNSQGDVVIPLRATGRPGWHFIDLYPAIYKGEEAPGQENFRIPQLTFAEDHPGEDLPAFHFAFLIER